MVTEGQRLRYYIESKDVSIRSFCIESDILYTSFHPILQDARPLGMNILKKIMDAYPNLNVNWLLTGKGNVEIDSDAEGAMKEPQPIYGKIDPGFEAWLKYFDNPITIKKLNQIIESKIKENGTK